VAGIHALIADALELGYADTIRGFRRAIEMGLHPA
jgi:pyridoxine 5'-phosphate synthase PdxJ